MNTKRMEKDFERLRTICLALPEVVATTNNHTTFTVRAKKFAYHLVDHHGDGRISLECKAQRGDNNALVESDPERFFLPKYMAHHGWVGFWLDLGTIDWDEVRELVTDAYLLVAPKRLADQAPD